MAKMQKMFTEQQVNELDRRRQLQIENQIGIIDRLLEGDTTYEGELLRAHEELATAQAERDAALRDVDVLRRGLAGE